MMKLTIVSIALVALAATVPAEFPKPGHLAFVLSEDDFEDYIDDWLQEQYLKTNLSLPSISKSTRNGCSVKINGDLGEPQPVYIQNDNYMLPTGTTGTIQLSRGERVTIACTGSGRVIQHPNILTSTATATTTCLTGTHFSGAGWLSGSSEFAQITCSTHAHHVAEATNERCYNNNLVIRVGFIVKDTFYPLYWSCFDRNRLEVLYSWHSQDPTNGIHQANVPRPAWLASSFYPGVAINTLYTQSYQKKILADIVGDELADKYITHHQYLARGHLATRTNFVYATGQRATFYFINSAPQWQPFNAGNWNGLEQSFRARVAAVGYNTVLYTGTFGVAQLRNANNQLVDIYLHRDDNNNPQVPVPLYYYKVAYDPTRRLGTAFVSINSPYYTDEEYKSLTFCTDRCRNNDAFNWLQWEPDRSDIGYSFCCTVDEFRRKIPHLPSFTVNGLLT